MFLKHRRSLHPAGPRPQAPPASKTPVVTPRSAGPPLPAHASGLQPRVFVTARPLQTAKLRLLDLDRHPSPGGPVAYSSPVKIREHAGIPITTVADHRAWPPRARWSCAGPLGVHRFFSATTPSRRATV